MKSMTGYGSAEGRVGEGRLFAEVRSINSRFLDITCRIPPSLYPLESKIKKVIQNRILRGKVEVFLKEKRGFSSGTLRLSVNKELVKQYKDCLKQIAKMLGIKTSSHLLEVVDLKDLLVFHEEGVDVEPLWGEIEGLIARASARVDRMRTVEGMAIRRDQSKRLARLLKLVSSVEKRSESSLQARRKKLEQELRDAPLNETPAADKFDVTEELTRLKSHLHQYRSIIARKGAVGRQLDFLIQEMHREINTIGSKCADGNIANLVVEAKSEIERLREQVQNVE